MNDSETNQRLEAILERVLELTPSERAAYLEEACDGDAALRTRLDSLLSIESEMGPFMGDPTLGNDELASEMDALLGSTIGPYKLLQLIGEGGYGVVYLAEQREPLSRRVALKVIKLGMDTKQVVARFEAERQALAMMEHPNIAKVLDAGATDAGRPYFVMELVRGVPITEYCDQDRLTTESRLQLFAQVCRAVHHAHQKGIIHRDLKPNNILVTLHDGVPVPKVIDFGIAKATNFRLTEKTLFTDFRQFIGTPAYTSPEQVEMSGLDVDTRSDIYSLGVLLYELLTGTTPVEADTLKKAAYVEIQRTILETEPPKPSTRFTEIRKRALADPHLRVPNSVIHQELDWIAMKALEKDRARRYESASAFAQDIENFLTHEPVSAAAPSTLYRLRKFARRHKAAAASAGAIFGALLVGIIVAIAFYSREREARADVEEREQRLLEAQYAHDMQAVSRALERGSASLAEGILRRHLPTEGRPDHREWYWRYLMGQLYREMAVSTVFDEGAREIAVSHNGKRIARIEGTKTQLLTFPSLKIERVLEFPGSWSGGFFSQDDSKFIARNKDLSVVDLESDITTTFIPQWKTEAAMALPTPDEKWVITISTVPMEGNRPKAIELACFDATTGESVAVAQKHVTAPNRFSLEDEIKISPDSRWITICSYDRSVRLFAIPSMEEVARFPVQDQANTVAWSPDSTQLAVGYDYPQDVELWNVPLQKHLRTLHSPNLGPKTDLAFSQDGSLIAAGHMMGAITVWDSHTAEMIEKFVTLSGGAVEFMPDGTLVSCGNREIKKWDVPSAREITELERLSQSYNIWNLAYSPDGDLLATTASDGVVRLFEAVTGDLVHSFPSRLTPGGHRPPYGGAPLAFADNRTLVAANGDHTVSVLDVVTRELKMLLDKHQGAIANLAISADGDVLATTGEDRMMIVWDMATGKELERSRGPKWIDFSPVAGSRLLAYRDKNGFGLLDLRSRVNRHCPTKLDVWAMRFSPDGLHLIVGVNGAESWLYDTERFARIGTLPPVAGAVRLNYSADDGRNLVMPSWGHGAHLWHMDTGLSLGPLPLSDAQDWVYSAAFSPDGNTLVVSSRGHGIQLLKAPSWNELEAHIR